MQRFSWQTCTVCAAGAGAGGGGGAVLGACSSRQFLKLNSLKCNFLHSLDWNWITRKVFKAKKKNMLTIKWIFDFCNYNNYWLTVFCFLVDSKTNSNQKECMSPWWQKVIHRYVQSSCCLESSEKSNKKRFSLSLEKYLFCVRATGDYLSDIAPGVRPETKPLLV